MPGRRKLCYLRISQEDGDVANGSADESVSIQSQRLCISRYLLNHPEIGNYDDFEELVDDGYSGTNFRRPGIERLLKMVEADMVDTIIVKDLSRFARNYLEAGHFLEFVFPTFHVRFISINDRYDSNELGESTAGFSLAIHNLINQLYSRDISRKIKSVVDLKKMNGEYCYGAVPYGYKKGEKHNTIVIDKEAAYHVAQIFEWASDGVAVTQIAARLNSAGVPTPSEYLKEVRGKYKTSRYWSFDSVKNILINRIYTGDTVPFKSHVVAVGSNRVKLLPESERIVIPDTHEAIVSRETFYKAHTVIKGAQKKKAPSPGSLLSPYVVCGCCGNKLHKGRASNRTFRCATARYAPDAPCADVSVREETLKNVLLHAIRNECAIADAKILAAKTAQKGIESERIAIERELQTERKQLEKAQSAAVHHYESYVNGQLDKEGYLQAKNEEKQKEESAKLQISLLLERQNRLVEERESADAMAKESAALSGCGNIETLTAPLLKELLKSVTVYPEGAINISWLFKDNLDWDDAKWRVS